MKIIERLIGQTKPKIAINVFCALLHEYVRGNVSIHLLNQLIDAPYQNELLRILQWLGSAPFARMEQLRHCLILGEAGIYKTASDVETALDI